MTTEPQRELVEQLSGIEPSLGALERSHLEEYGELLPHVLMADVTRFFVQQVREGSDSSRAIAARVAAALEAALKLGDDSAKELVLASFVENLVGEEPTARIHESLPEELRQALMRFQRG